MVEASNPFDAFRTIFTATPFGSQAQSYEALQQRRRIAEMMMARPRAHPKTFGEGLSAIGDALGASGYADSVAKDAAAAGALETEKTTAPPPASVSTYTPYNPEATAAPPPAPTTFRPPAGTTGRPAAGGEVSDNYGYQPAPSYLQPALASSGLDPERQAYLGHLAGKEARSANEVSPTGAAGPFQFTRGTGAQYGIPGDKRFDPSASIAAASKLTDDNAAVLAEGLGRAPTGSELALAHQQGAGTAVKMILGTGNASARNLAVNNASGGPQEAANKVMSYYGMPGANPARDGAAAVLASRTAATPLTEADTAQEGRVADVIGLSKGPTGNYAYPATASRGDVSSDIAPSGVTGTGDGTTAAAVGDTAQKRSEAVRNGVAGALQQQTAPPAGQGQVLAQNAVTGGGKATADVSRAAPITKAPETVDLPSLGPKPVPPKLLPMENARTQHFDAIAGDIRLSPTARQRAHEQGQVERANIKALNDQQVSEYNKYLEPWIAAKAKREDPQTQLAIKKAQRELEGEGAVALTPDQRKAYGIPDTQSAYMTRTGEIKFGPAGTHVNVNTGEKAAGKGDERLQEKLSEHFIKTFEEGNTAADDLRSVTTGRALASRIQASPLTFAKQALGEIGIKTQGLSDIQAFDAWVSRTIPQQRVPGSGTSSDFDGAMFKKSIPTLMTTPEGKNLIFDTMEQAAQNKLARAEIAGQVVAGTMSRSDGVTKTLELQREARAISDKVEGFLKASGKVPDTAKAVPSDDAMRKWLQDNPNDPNAARVRKTLGM